MTERVKNIPALLSQYIGPNKIIVSSKVSNLTAPGENYLSLALKIDVLLKDKISGKEEKLYGAAKCVTNPHSIESWKKSYNRELAFYIEILPTLQKFAEEQCLKSNFDLFPKLIAYRPNLHGENDEVDENSILVLENLKIDGKF